MEQLDLSNLSQSTCLVRENMLTKPGQTGSVTDLVTPRTDGQVVFLAPGSSLSAGQGKRKEGKRKAGENEEEDSLPVEVTKFVFSYLKHNITILRLKNIC